MNNIFSSLNSLVWLLIVILIIVAVVMVIRAVTRPRGGAVVEQPVVQQQPPPPPAPGLAPGWYPDQNDASLSRYFDGRAWTSSTQPRH